MKRMLTAPILTWMFLYQVCSFSSFASSQAVQSPVSSKSSQVVVKPISGSKTVFIENLEWVPNLSNNLEGDYLVPSYPEIGNRRYESITHRLTSASPSNPKFKVTFGFNSNGGGYQWSAKIFNAPDFSPSAVEEGFESGAPGFGKGMLGSIRDRFHKNFYNPEQAGRNDVQGAPTRTGQFSKAVHVPQFKAPLFSDGSLTSRPVFPFKSLESEFDYSSLSEDAADLFGIPSISHKEYWIFARPASAIKEFTLAAGGLDPSYRISDISPSPEIKARPTDEDMSYIAQSIRGIRPGPEFPYLHLRINGFWTVRRLSADSMLNCSLKINNGNTFYFEEGNVRATSINNKDCDIDFPLLIVSTSPELSTGAAIGLYIPINDPLNSRQSIVIDKKNGFVSRAEDRRIGFVFSVGGIINSETAGKPYRFIVARAFLSGLLSPNSAETTYGRQVLEGLTNRSYTLYGTPKEIIDSVSKFELKPGDCWVNGQRIRNGQSRTFFADYVAVDTVVASEVRTCQNGLLSGRSEFRFPFLFKVDSSDAFDIYAIAGQSNSVGVGIGLQFENMAYENYADRVFQMGQAEDPNDQTLFPGLDSLNHWGNRPSYLKGFGVPFARRVASLAENGRKILLIPAGRGSTSIVQWDAQIDELVGDSGTQHYDTTALYDNMVSRIRLALSMNPNNRFKGFLWQQGGADIMAMANPRHPARLRSLDQNSYSSSFPAEYKRRLVNLRSKLRAKFADQGCFPFLIGQESNNWKDPALEQNWHVLVSEMESSKSSDPCGKTAVVPSSGLHTNSLAGQNDFAGEIHLSAEGQRQFGARFFNALKLLMTDVSP